MRERGVRERESGREGMIRSERERETGRVRGRVREREREVETQRWTGKEQVNG